MEIKGKKKDRKEISQDSIKKKKRRKKRKFNIKQSTENNFADQRTPDPVQRSTSDFSASR